MIESVRIRIRDGVEKNRYKVGSFGTQRLLLSHFYLKFIYAIINTATCDVIHSLLLFLLLLVLIAVAVLLSNSIVTNVCSTLAKAYPKDKGLDFVPQHTIP